MGFAVETAQCTSEWSAEAPSLRVVKQLHPSTTSFVPRTPYARVVTSGEIQRALAIIRPMAVSRLAGSAKNMSDFSQLAALRVPAAWWTVGSCSTELCLRLPPIRRPSGSSDRQQPFSWSIFPSTTPIPTRGTFHETPIECLEERRLEGPLCFDHSSRPPALTVPPIILPRAF